VISQERTITHAVIVAHTEGPAIFHKGPGSYDPNVYPISPMVTNNFVVGALAGPLMKLRSMQNVQRWTTRSESFLSANLHQTDIIAIGELCVIIGKPCKNLEPSDDPRTHSRLQRRQRCELSIMAGSSRGPLFEVIRSVCPIGPAIMSHEAVEEQIICI